MPRLINEESRASGRTITDNKLTQLSSVTRRRAYNGKHAVHNIGDGLSGSASETTASIV